MKIKLLLFAGLCSFTHFSVSSFNYKEAIAEMYEDHTLKDKIVYFFQTAIDGFMRNEKVLTISADEVIQSFLGRAKSEIKDVKFESYEQFISWVKDQKKTLLFLYDDSDIGSAIVYEYLKKMSSDSRRVSKAEIVKIVLKLFLDKVVKVKPEAQDNQIVLHDLDLAPNVVMIEGGNMQHLSLDELYQGLKNYIDAFLIE